MKFNKKTCGIRIRLTPCGCDFQKVQICIGGDRHILWPSSVMGCQFSELLDILYSLYSENDLFHSIGKDQTIPPDTGPYPVPYYHTINGLSWDDEGRIDRIILTRMHENPSRDLPDSLDKIQVDLDLYYGKYSYTVDGIDLCYAVAKACTEAIKKYGLFGYASGSDSSQYAVEQMNINQLFVKAYALGGLHIRSVTKLWEDPHHWERAVASSLADEIELLLFDM